MRVIYTAHFICFYFIYLLYFENDEFTCDTKWKLRYVLFVVKNKIFIPKKQITLNEEKKTYIQLNESHFNQIENRAVSGSKQKANT